MKQLNNEQLEELANDVEELKKYYNFIEFTADKSPHFPTFDEIKRLSMQSIRKRNS